MSRLPWILLTVACVVAGQLLQKVGMRKVGAIDVKRLRSPATLALAVLRQPAVIGGFTVYGLSALLWLYVLSRTELSFAYPFLSLAYAGVPAAATLVLKESFTWRQWLGLVLVISGVVVVASSGAQGWA